MRTLIATLAALLATAPLTSRPAEADAPAPAADAVQPSAVNAEPAVTPAPRAAPPRPAAPLEPVRARPEAGEEIVVTATRSRRPVGSLPVAVGVISRADIEKSPTKAVDELLRIDPSFALFRRSSSIAADPSSQGVKLRGVGTSGVSRTLVLMDGIPENDPFGGWVAWRSISRLSTESIEVVPGGASALYGNYALGGVVQVLSRPMGDRQVELTSEAGSFGTAQVAGAVTERLGSLRSSVDGEILSSEGYPVVASWQRGSVDGDTPSRHAAVRARLEGDANSDFSYALRGGYFWEDLNGGTDNTTAMVRRAEYAGTLRWSPGEAGAFDLALYGHTGEFQQNRGVLLVTGNRNAGERQSAHQDVPTDDVGSGLLWTSRRLALAGEHTLNVGADGRWIGGETRENLFPTAATQTFRDAKGQQWLYGVFAQDNYDLGPRVGLNVALRYDRWDNVAASRLDIAANGTSTRTPFPDRTDHALSPKVGLRVRPVDWVALRAAAYRSFRAPTLDELYRPFQVGPVRTEANENLGPETLRGAEAGFDVLLSRLTARVTGFWNEIEDPIINVTCATAALCPALSPSITPGPNTRQRQNLGTARIRGVEAAGSWRLVRGWSVGAAYTYAENEITDAPGQPQIVGKRLPQDPLHMASASLAWTDPRWAAAQVQLRYIGRQYEDDVNTQPMGEAWLVDLFASWHMTPSFDLFLAVENLLDRTYLVGRAGGLNTIGQPRFIHGGVRFRTGG
jgi:outer membrane receptor protein involved in Fe transport